MVLGILSGEHFSPVAREGDTIDGLNVQRVRGIGLDPDGRAFYEAMLSNPARPNDPLIRSLRLATATENVEIVRERSAFPGDQKTVVAITNSRIGHFGNIVFVTSLGRVTGQTVAVDEIRATLRRTDGSLVTLASSTESAQLGPISELLILGVESEQKILLLAERNQSSDRALLLADASSASQ